MYGEESFEGCSVAADFGNTWCVVEEPCQGSAYLNEAEDYHDCYTNECVCAETWSWPSANDISHDEACVQSHDDREGETSGERCEAMPGCTYDNSTDGCYSERGVGYDDHQGCAVVDAGYGDGPEAWCPVTERCKGSEPLDWMQDFTYCQDMLDADAAYRRYDGGKPRQQSRLAIVAIPVFLVVFFLFARA